MRKNTFPLLSVLTVILLTLPFQEASAKGCGMHFYNSSDQTWTISVNSTYGKFGMDYGGVKNADAITLLAHQIASVYYTYNGAGHSAGDMTFKDSDGNSEKFHYSNYNGSYLWQCPAIDSKGLKTPIHFNWYPGSKHYSDGDLDIVGGKWPKKCGRGAALSCFGS